MLFFYLMIFVVFGFLWKSYVNFRVDKVNMFIGFVGGMMCMVEIVGIWLFCNLILLILLVFN